MKGKTAGGKCQREGRYISCLDLGTISLGVQQVSFNSSSLPVLLQRVDLYPVRAVIPKRPRREANLSRNKVPADARDLINPLD